MIHKNFNFYSGKDGNVGRYISLPHTTKRRITTNLKTKNNQNCQRIELYGSLTTKELQTKHLSRPAKGAEMGGQAEMGRWEKRICGKTGAGRPDIPHSHADKPGETTEE